MCRDMCDAIAMQLVYALIMHMGGLVLRIAVYTMWSACGGQCNSHLGCVDWHFAISRFRLIIIIAQSKAGGVYDFHKRVKAGIESYWQWMYIWTAEREPQLGRKRTGVMHGDTSAEREPQLVRKRTVVMHGDTLAVKGQEFRRERTGVMHGDVWTSERGPLQLVRKRTCMGHVWRYIDRNRAAWMESERSVYLFSLQLRVPLRSVVLGAISGIKDSVTLQRRSLVIIRVSYMAIKITLELLVHVRSDLSIFSHMHFVPYT